jgi:hypothetical protein
MCHLAITPEPGQEETVRIVAMDRNFHINCYKCEVNFSRQGSFLINSFSITHFKFQIIRIVVFLCRQIRKTRAGVFHSMITFTARAVISYEFVEAVVAFFRMVVQAQSLLILNLAGICQTCSLVPPIYKTENQRLLLFKL